MTVFGQHLFQDRAHQTHGHALLSGMRVNQMEFPALDVESNCSLIIQMRLLANVDSAEKIRSKS